MKIGLFFGSFNPVHIGHMIIANHMVEHSELNQVWMVVTPQNPLKNRRQLLNEYDRLEMVNLAIGDNPNIKASDIEFNLPRPSFTIDTLTYLHEKYPEHEFVLIMGSDTVNTLPKWKNYDHLMSNYSIYAYPRPNAQIENPAQNLRVFEVPMMEISASFIRRCIRNNKSVQYLLPQAVYEFLDKGGHYRN